VQNVLKNSKIIWISLVADFKLVYFIFQISPYLILMLCCN